MMDLEESPGTLAFRAENGDRSAQYRLGLLFLLGQEVEQDLAAARRWLELAGDRDGAHLLVEKLAQYRAANLMEKKGFRTEALRGSSRSLARRAVTFCKVLWGSSCAPLWAWLRSRSLGRLVRIRLRAGIKDTAMDGNRGPNGLSEIA